MNTKPLLVLVALLLAVNATQAQTCNGLAATITGTADADDIVGTEGPDVIVGLGGDDRIEGLGGDDIICGGDGDDDLLGGDGDDLLFGDSGDDVIEGNADSDTCRGVSGIDSAALDCEIRSDVDTDVYPVQLQASDGIPLDGLLYVPSNDAATQGTRTVAIIVSHGAMGSAFSSIPKTMGLQAAPLGFTVLALNRRDWGQDGGGGAVLFEDATLDVGVGVNFLNGLGYDLIFVAGHSQGTQNAAIYPSFTMDERVAAVGLYGTVDDGRSTARDLLFVLSYDDDVTRAEQLVADGQGDDIVAWPTVFAVDLFRSAANFLSFWGPDTLSVVEREIASLTVPALLMRADGDEFTPDQMSLNVMATANAAGIDATYTVLDFPFPLTDNGGNAHGFVGVEREMISETLDWLVSRVPESDSFTQATKLTSQNPPGNIEPVAGAGPDQSFIGSQPFVELNSASSADVDGIIVDRFWTQTGGAAVTLSDSTAVRPSFTASIPERDTLFGVPEPQKLVFEVTVTDDDGGTDTDEVEITIGQSNLIEVSQSNGTGPLALIMLLYLTALRRRTRLDR